jgi:hypothetical protein
MKMIKTFEEFVNENLNESKNYWTVVSNDSSRKWGIEGDFEAKSEDDAIKLAKKQVEKYGVNRFDFYAFPAGSEELEDFINTHDFID